MARGFDSRTPSEQVRPHRRARPGQQGVFEVTGRDARTTYRVLVLPGRVQCECPAGVRGKDCWHRQMVLDRHAEEIAALRREGLFLVSEV